MSDSPITSLSLWHSISSLSVSGIASTLSAIMDDTKKDEVTHFETASDTFVSFHPQDRNHMRALLNRKQVKDAAQAEHDSWLNDKPRARKLRRKMDLRLMPLCAFMYLLNYLDRGNIGNAKLLNEETGDSMIQSTNMTNLEYAVAVSLFAVAYAVFEVPSNWIMKRYVRPSRWLGTLLFCWGVFTIGFSGVQNFAQVTVLRFFIGAFEAGFFPGKSLYRAWLCGNKVD